MKILFICTAHNSLSQRLYLSLSQLHAVTVEYALSEDAMREAVQLAKPDLIICPFLTTRVPRDIYDEYMTLIVHPGPPGDAGPSSLDWVLMGDDGTEPDAAQLLQPPRASLSDKGRPYWGVTVLQAEDAFDAGPVWAYEQFALDIDAPGLTKSGLYRGPVTRAAVSACLAAIDRINAAAYTAAPLTPPLTPRSSGCQSPSHHAASSAAAPTTSSTTAASYRAIHPGLAASPAFRELSVGLQKPFLGGPTHHRPLLKAGQRDFDVRVHSAREISRRIRCSDSQPGCLTSVLGPSLYVYGGDVEEDAWVVTGGGSSRAAPGAILAVRDHAVCIKTCDKRGVWITHVRRVKKKADPQLWPKVPAVSGLRELGLLSPDAIAKLSRPHAAPKWARAPYSTFQEVWVDLSVIEEHSSSSSSSSRVAYVYADFYNGAMSTAQCDKLIDALDYVLSTHSAQHPLAAVVMMGGAGYFSNGIHLNVIEAAADPAQESWDNINRINDVVHYLLHEFPRRNILTIAGVRGNAAAGGVALATACDCVVAGAEVVLNPAYRALGLYGSEYHSISYMARCGREGGRRLLRDMMPISAYDARSMGVVDHVLPGHGALLETRIKNHVKAVVRSLGLHRSASTGSNSSSGSGSGWHAGGASRYLPGAWKAHADLSPSGLAQARAMELGEMARDFWSPRAVRYHARRTAFVRKMKATTTPLRFAEHRRGGTGAEPIHMDEEETDDFDSVEYFARKTAKELEARVAEELVALRQLALHTEEEEAEKLLAQAAATVDVTAAETAAAGVKTQGQGPVFACYYGA